MNSEGRHAIYWQNGVKLFLKSLSAYSIIYIEYLNQEEFK